MGIQIRFAAIMRSGLRLASIFLAIAVAYIVTDNLCFMAGLDDFYRGYFCGFVVGAILMLIELWDRP